MEHPKTKDEYNKMRDTDKLVVVQFSTSWCGPCKSIKPNVEKLAAANPSIVFIYVDIEQLEIPDGDDVRSVPTFKYYKNRELETTLKGVGIEQITKTVQDLSNT